MAEVDSLPFELNYENPMVRETATIEAVSFSRLDVYEQCARRAYYAYCKKIPEPDRGPPHSRCPTNPETGQREWHNDRGTRLHDSLDKYVRGVNDKYDVELKCLDVEMTNARAAFEQGLVLTEQMWCYKEGWEPTRWDDWDNIRIRVKTDITWITEGDLDEPHEAAIIDLKSGRKFGNEAKHASQLQLYAIGAFKRWPSLDTVYAEIWYCDQDDIKTIQFTREQMVNFQPEWDDRFEVAMSDVVFEPSPSESTCKYCPYKLEADGGTGDCEKAYSYSKPQASAARTPTKAKKGSRSRAG